MGKRVRLRPWFHKLSIKRFTTTVSARRCQRGQSSSSLHDLLGDFDPSSPRSRRAFSASSPRAPCPQKDSFSALCPPAARHSFTVYRDQNPVFSPGGRPQRATSASEGRTVRRGHGSKLAYINAELNSPFSAFSPVNLKAKDTPYPGGAASPVPLQSPYYSCLREAASNSPRVSQQQVFSPPNSASNTLTVFFRSPLHPLVHNISANPNPKCRSASEKTASHSRPPLAACEAQHVKNHTKQRPMSTRSNKESVLIVDCGCRPKLSASFRKTKQKIQACSSMCSSSTSNSKPGLMAASHQDGESRDVQIARSRSCSDSTVNYENPETRTLLTKQGLHASIEAVSEDHKFLPQRKTRKKPDAGAMNPKGIVHMSNGRFSTQKAWEDIDCDLNADVQQTSPNNSAALFNIGDPRSLIWDKEFSSFTSEDTFFSSFERSRPSFSSISSSECFDKKLGYTSSTNLACTNYKAPWSDAKRGVASDPGSILPASDVHKDGTKKLLEGNIDVHESNPKLGGADPLVEVILHGVLDMDKGLVDPLKELSNSHLRAKPTRAMSSHGSHRSSLTSLVGIKEDPGEFNSGLNSLRRCNSSLESGPLCQQLTTSQMDAADADYGASSPSASDYYGKRTPVKSRKKSNEKIKSNSNDSGDVILSRRTQLEEKWKLSEKQVRWHEDSSEDTDASDHARNISPFFSSAMNGKPNTKRGRRRRAISRSKQASKLMDASALELKVSNELNASTLRGLTPLLSSIPGGSTASLTAPVRDVLTNSALCNGVNDKCMTAINGSISQRITQKEKSAIATNSRLVDSLAVVKCSKDPLIDFRDSMLDMILEKQIYLSEDLEELLHCFLSLNSWEHHDTIIRAFKQVWKVFHDPT